jgi:hypothetical protein
MPTESITIHAPATEGDVEVLVNALAAILARLAREQALPAKPSDRQPLKKAA